MTNLYHLPHECKNYETFYPLPFSHWRYFGIVFRKFIYKHRTNSPYISSESLASIVDLSVLSEDELKNVKLESVKKSKSVFLKADLLEIFMDRFGRSLPRLVLFTGHSDRNFDIEPSIPANVVRWYCQNSAISDGKRIFTLPIGIENLSLGRAGRKRFFRATHTTRKLEVFVPPMSPTNPIRKPIVLECRSNPLFEIRTNFLDERSYFDLSSQYRFVLCLEGNGYENHRIWETLYQGNFPILLKSNWSRALEYLALPILLVNSIDEITEELLRSFADLHKNYDPLNHANLWIDYWRGIAAMNFDNIPEL